MTVIHSFYVTYRIDSVRVKKTNNRIIFLKPLTLTGFSSFHPKQPTLQATIEKHFSANISTIIIIL